MVNKDLLSIINKNFVFEINNLIFNSKGDKVAYIVERSPKLKELNTIASGDEIVYNKISYVMINDKQISPEMLGASITSPKDGQFMYAGIDVSTLVLHHVKIDF